MNETLRTKIENYKTPQSVLTRLRPIKTVILFGITAAGKDTIIRKILDLSDDFTRVVNSTTRAPRENSGVLEQDGVNYYFLDIDQVDDKLNNHEYIEVADVHGNVYGSLVAEYERIASHGKVALTDIDYQGVMNFADFGMDNLSIYFVVPPSFEVWLARLAKRQGGKIERDKDLITRLESALKELASVRENQNFIPVMNIHSDETAQKIIEHTLNGTRPTGEEFEGAYKIIDDLSVAIVHYIDELKDEY